MRAALIVLTACGCALSSWSELSAQAGRSGKAGNAGATSGAATTYRARLAPVPIDLAMLPVVTGSGSVSAVLAGTKLSVTGSFEGLKSPATLAKIHRSPARGVRGPEVFALTVSSGTSGTITGALELSPAQVADLAKGRLYVQLHSEKAPDGNLWGWLLPQENKR